MLYNCLLVLDGRQQRVTGDANKASVSKAGSLSTQPSNLARIDAA